MKEACFENDALGEKDEQVQNSESITAEKNTEAENVESDAVEKNTQAENVESSAVEKSTGIEVAESMITKKNEAELKKLQTKNSYMIGPPPPGKPPLHLRRSVPLNRHPISKSLLRGPPETTLPLPPIHWLKSSNLLD